MKPLKRHPVLIELSREHHGSLSLCVRLLRTPEQSHQEELDSHFAELEPHFLEEETMFAPYWDKAINSETNSFRVITRMSSLHVTRLMQNI